MKKLVGFLFCMGFLLFSGTVEANYASDAPNFGNVVYADNTGDECTIEAMTDVVVEYSYTIPDALYEAAELQMAINTPRPAVIELYHNHRICNLSATNKIPIQLQNGFSLLCELPPAKIDS